MAAMLWWSSELDAEISQRALFLDVVACRPVVLEGASTLRVHPHFPVHKNSVLYRTALSSPSHVSGEPDPTFILAVLKQLSGRSVRVRGQGMPRQCSVPSVNKIGSFPVCSAGVLPY